MAENHRRRALLEMDTPNASSDDSDTYNEDHGLPKTNTYLSEKLKMSYATRLKDVLVSHLSRELQIRQKYAQINSYKNVFSGTTTSGNIDHSKNTRLVKLAKELVRFHLSEENPSARQNDDLFEQSTTLELKNKINLLIMLKNEIFKRQEKKVKLNLKMKKLLCRSGLCKQTCRKCFQSLQFRPAKFLKMINQNIAELENARALDEMVDLENFFYCEIASALDQWKVNHLLFFKQLVMNQLIKIDKVKNKSIGSILEEIRRLPNIVSTLLDLHSALEPILFVLHMFLCATQFNVNQELQYDRLVSYENLMYNLDNEIEYFNEQNTNMINCLGNLPSELEQLLDRQAITEEPDEELNERVKNLQKNLMDTEFFTSYIFLRTSASTICKDFKDFYTGMSVFAKKVDEEIQAEIRTIRAYKKLVNTKCRILLNKTRFLESISNYKIYTNRTN